MSETDRQAEPVVPARDKDGRFAPMACRHGVYGCADCERERAREAYRRWRAKNKERVLEYNKKFAAANPDVMKARRERFLAKLAARGLTWAQYCAERRRAKAGQRPGPDTGMGGAA